jgi:hypothetical protein
VRRERGEWAHGEFEVDEVEELLGGEGGGEGVAGE